MNGTSAILIRTPEKDITAWLTLAKNARTIVARKGATLMKRKRFVKCLMGKGLPRNKALRFAEVLRKQGIRYGDCTEVSVSRLGSGLHHISFCIPKRRKLEPDLTIMVPSPLNNGFVPGYLMEYCFPKPGEKAKNPGWAESEMQKWLNTSLLAPPLPKEWQNLIDASRYAASVYNPD